MCYDYDYSIMIYVTRNVTGLCVLMRKRSRNGYGTKNVVFYLGFRFWNEKNVSCETIRSAQRFQQKLSSVSLRTRSVAYRFLVQLVICVEHLMNRG